MTGKPTPLGKYRHKTNGRIETLIGTTKKVRWGHGVWDHHADIALYTDGIEHYEDSLASFLERFDKVPDESAVASSDSATTVAGLDEYQALAQRTANPNQDFKQRLMIAALGLCGEAGEFADAVKKHVGHGHPLDDSKLALEAGDVLWYAAEAAAVLGFNLSVVASRNVAKLRARFPAGFSTEASLARVDTKSPEPAQSITGDFEWALAKIDSGRAVWAEDGPSKHNRAATAGELYVDAGTGTTQWRLA